MVTQDILIDMIDKIQEANLAQQNELVRIATTISIEIPEIKKKLEETQKQVKALEDIVNKFDTAIESMDAIVQSMKPIVQFFTFMKWLAIGIVVLLGWVGSYASGLWDVIEKLFHK